nr:hypothetical protein [uncultured Lichenicoccus sp.]
MLTGSCHCSAVRIEVEHTPTYLNQCLCSVCRRYGVLWAYYRPDQVRVVGALEAYSRGERHLAFNRWGTCGCVTHWSVLDGEPDRLGINARLLDPSDIADVPIRQSSGPP